MRRRSAFLLLAFVLLLFATAADTLHCCDSGQCYNGGSGATPTPVPAGPFVYNVLHRSTVQFPLTTYSGRLTITINPATRVPIGQVNFSMTGTEQCAGKLVPGWSTSYALTNWGSVDMVKDAPFRSPLDCGAVLVAHTLQWGYAWTLENASAPTVIGSYSDSCDFTSGSCGDYAGAP